MKFKFNKKTVTTTNVFRSAKKILFFGILCGVIYLLPEKFPEYLIFLFCSFLVFWLFFEIERFYNHMNNIKYQELEITSQEMITKNIKKGTSTSINKDRFKLGKVKIKNGKIVSINIKYDYSPCALSLEDYEDMENLLLCLKNMKSNKNQRVEYVDI